MSWKYASIRSFTQQAFSKLGTLVSRDEMP